VIERSNIVQREEEEWWTVLMAMHVLAGKAAGVSVADDQS
jgi:hypothetical protein